MKNKGFTLIELIVVITIIALVTAVTAVSFTGINRKARDSKRVSDLEKIRIALEMYKQNNGKYPAPSGDSLLAVGLVPDYIQAIPTDPKSFKYSYEPESDRFSYKLYAQMEDDASKNSLPGCYYGPSCGGVLLDCNYCVSSP
jgi:general secretion pathway protein G